MVQISKRTCARGLIALLVSPMIGCGSSGPSSLTTQDTVGPSGRSIQGPMSGSTIWGDSLAAGLQFAIDPTENNQTTTNGGGTFTLPKTPNYKYVLLSQGGTDTLTGRPGTTMIGPGGGKSISPLTTLVMVDSSGKLATTLGALLPNGATFDADFTGAGALTPGGTLFLTSIVSVATSIAAGIQEAALKSGATITDQQWNDIYISLYASLANQFAPLSAAQLANTQTLSTTIDAGLTNALTSIAANNPNIKGLNPTTLAKTVADQSVATAANIVGNATGNAALKAVTPSNVQSTSIPVSTTTTITESGVITGTNLLLLLSSIDSTASSVSTGITVTSTPGNYAPPTIPVVKNPSVVGYNLTILADGSTYEVNTFTITFSDDMVASNSGGSNYAHSVLNPANYTFSQTGCTPSSYASDVVTFTCNNLNPGNFTVTLPAATANGGVWASSTSLGFLVNQVKTFSLPSITGGTGGNSFNLF
jgi:hypothetical protein